MGACPDAYALVQAAKYLGVAPWDMLTHSLYWKDTALRFLQAEAAARKIVEQRG